MERSVLAHYVRLAEACADSFGPVALAKRHSGQDPDAGSGPRRHGDVRSKGGILGPGRFKRSVSGRNGRQKQQGRTQHRSHDNQLVRTWLPPC